MIEHFGLALNLAYFVFKSQHLPLLLTLKVMPTILWIEPIQILMNKAICGIAAYETTGNPDILSPNHGHDPLGRRPDRLDNSSDQPIDLYINLPYHLTNKSSARTKLSSWRT
ncbi:hypothetical protein EUGRSUZ_I02075 [Eucalyptus grandis]|uniref:Uncharacterized protein n=2 Tax=Eucalyptus grandis TaxID=71139 RepID=A0ACC3JHG6_EUCGR|nr:hypothetical protein EUGRSUZ_I02075 [Eucalyptus grandis]